jgi:hypothetical protein
MLIEIFRYAPVATSLLAACLWLAAAKAKVEAGEPGSFSITADDQGSGVFAYDGLDLRATLQKQSFWNTWAAIVTAVSVALQASVPLIAGV